MSITADAESIKTDVPRGAHPRLSDAAIERAKEQFAVTDMAAVAQRLGFANTMSLWRARVGLTLIRLSDAWRIADLLALPLDTAFEKGGDSA